MSAFAVLRHPGAIAELCDLSRRPAGHSWTHEWLLGLWIETDGRSPRVTPRPGGDITRRLAKVPSLRLRVPSRRPGEWSVCGTNPIDRMALLDLLVYLSDAGSGRIVGRFVPVFREDEDPSACSAELDALCDRYPGVVISPMQQDHQGRLQHGEPLLDVG